MKQIYDANRGNRKKAESLQSIAKRFNVPKSRLYEMTAGHKIVKREKGVTKQMEPDVSADTPAIAPIEKRHADDPKDSQGLKRQKVDTSVTKKGGKVKSTTP